MKFENEMDVINKMVGNILIVPIPDSGVPS